MAKIFCTCVYGKSFCVFSPIHANFVCDICGCIVRDIVSDDELKTLRETVFNVEDEDGIHIDQVYYKEIESRKVASPRQEHRK